MVKQMPTIAANQQPTIAIITYLYYEKIAVDAMMENKTTYVRYKTEGVHPHIVLVVFKTISVYCIIFLFSFV